MQPEAAKEERAGSVGRTAAADLAAVVSVEVQVEVEMAMEEKVRVAAAMEEVTVASSASAMAVEEMVVAAAAASAAAVAAGGRVQLCGIDGCTKPAWHAGTCLVAAREGSGTPSKPSMKGGDLGSSSVLHQLRIQATLSSA